MGVVYKARNLKMDRLVASRSLASDATGITTETLMPK